MARKRFVHPQMWSDGRVQDMTRDERLMFLGMITIQDDEQRLAASPLSLNGAIYPEDGLSNRLVERWRDQVCIKNPNVVLYTVEGRDYIWLGKAVRYQKPDHPTESVLPPPSRGKRIEPAELLAKHSRNARGSSETQAEKRIANAKTQGNGARK